MRFQEVQDALRRQPFEPFQIHLTNGQRFLIRHPEFAALSRSSVLVGVSSGDDDVPDRYIQCDLLHVVSLEPANGAPKNADRTEPGR